jgi:type I restriction-modification system DNA methylase subunit
MMSTRNEGKVNKTFTHLCSKLEYTRKNGLVESNSDAKDISQRYIFKQVSEKLGTDAVFFLRTESGQSIPLIYFHKLESNDRDAIAKLHKQVWNMGQAPLLFIVLPDIVLIYNAYEQPKILPNGQLDDEAGFIEELELFVEAKSEFDKLKKYRRSELLTGNYWQKYSKHFNDKNRVYQTLLDNLEFMRSQLLKKGLPTEVVHNLLTRSIFIKYLEDRTDNNGHNVFPKGFFSKFSPNARNFTDLLSDKNATDELFQYLNSKFNGDVFAIDKNGYEVSQEHLNLLKRMLKGDIYLEKGQMALWPLYSFDVIPIELISNIYQKFIHHEENESKTKNNGAHYTPYHLVTFLMDQVLPWEGESTKLKVLDPSCGSGVFLVESYRRLISRWMQANPNKSPSAPDLKRILRENIFGVDKNSNAIRIAALSLYLTMCDYLEPRYIWNQVRFEPIINKNIFVSDFFEKDAPFLVKKYDLIIGNPPWASELPETAIEYLKSNDKPIGDKQIAQAFLWRVAELCKPDGEICMLVSSKNLLFNRSNKNREFRKQFFSSFDIKTVINFSALRHILFSKAVGPPAAVIFSPAKKDIQNILYCSPKPSYSTQDNWLFIIEPHDIAYIPKNEAIENDIIWKVAMWGNPRDYELIKRLSTFPTLGDVCEEKGWINGEGFTVGKKGRKEDLELFGKPYVDTRELKKYLVEEERLPLLEEKYFVRSRTKKRQIFEGPHLLIKQSPTVKQGMIAAILRNDAVFRHSILGIHSNGNDLDQLAACCLSINTNIALYYEILTSRSWLVERDYFEKEEIMDLPMPENVLGLKEINYNLLNEISRNPEVDDIVNQLATKLYHLNESEIIQINDTIKYTLDYYRKKNNSIAVKPVDESTLREYIDIYCGILNDSFSSLDNVFVGTIYDGKGPLRVISTKLVEKPKKMDVPYILNGELESVLNRLDEQLIEEMSPSIYIRRNLRRYSGDTTFIVKPNQMRYWTQSAALRDADETYKDIMSSMGDF